MSLIGHVRQGRAEQGMTIVNCRVKNKKKVLVGVGRGKDGCGVYLPALSHLQLPDLYVSAFQ